MVKQIAAALCIVLCACILTPRTVAAAGDQIYFNPGTVSVSTGGTIAVQVRTVSDLAIAAVQANFTYDAAVLEYMSTAFDGGAYEFGIESSGSSGLVRMARATFNPKAGDNLVATVTFKAKAPVGTSTLAFTDDSEMTDGYTSVKATSPASLVTVTTQNQPVPIATPSPRPTTQVMPKITPIPAPTQLPLDTQPPILQAVNISDITYKGATLRFTTSELASVVIRYGVDNTYGNEVALDAATNHEYQFNQGKMLPATQYHYQITATDTLGNVTVTEDATFTTAGVLAVFKVKQSDGKPLVGGFVTVGGDTKPVDAAGKAYFETGVGLVHAVVALGTEKYPYDILISTPTEDGMVETHELIVPMSTSSSRRQFVVSILVATAGASLLCLVLLAIRHQHDHKM